VDGGHLLLLAQRSGAALQKPALFRRLSASRLTGISQDQRNRCSEKLSGTRMNRTKGALAYVLPEERSNMRK
jgi:hypothetical protein